MADSNYDPLANLTDSQKARLGLNKMPSFKTREREPPTFESLLGTVEPSIGEIGGGREVDYGPEQMTPEDIDALAGLGALGDDQTENSRQMALAEGLRDMEGASGRHAGRVFVAASPLEHLSVGVQKYRAAKDVKKLKSERTGIQEKQTEGRGKYWDLLRGKTAKDKVKMPKLEL